MMTGRGNTLSVGKGKNGFTIIFIVFTADYWECLKHLSLVSIPPQTRGNIGYQGKNLFMAFKMVVT